MLTVNIKIIQARKLLDSNNVCFVAAWKFGALAIVNTVHVHDKTLQHTKQTLRPWHIVCCGGI